MTESNALVNCSSFEELNISNECTNESDKYFAQVIGTIEEIVVDEKFTALQSTFLEKYWGEFDSGEENKLIYMEIFEQYLSTIETYIEKRLLECVNGFSMETFEQELQKRKNELDGEIFEILSTFSDFRAFKTMFLDYKEMKEGRTLDFSRAIIVSKCIRT